MKAFKRIQPKTSDDIKCGNDCMIRSVTLATGAPYNKVYELMYKLGWRTNRKTSKGNWEDQITKTLDELGFTTTKIKYPPIKGQSRMTAKTMPNTGNYILRIAKHVVNMNEGILQDTFDCSDKCVYFAWEITSKPS